MKKLLAVVTVVCIVLGLLGGCRESSENAGTKATEEIALPPQETENTELKEETPTTMATEAPEKITIEETVIYDENGIKITARSVFETESAFHLTLKLENHSDKKASFYLSHCILNGFSVMGRYGNLEAEPGTEDITSVAFENADMEFLGRKYWGTYDIATIVGANAELTVEDTVIPVPFSLVTSAGVDYEPSFDDSGEILYEKDGITVIYKEVIETTEGDALTLLVINETGKDFVLESVEEFVNGTEMGLPLWDYVFRDAISCCYIILSPDSLEHHGINKVETVRFALIMSNTETFRMFAKSDAIEISLPQ